jgi:hypothetical protein
LNLADASHGARVEMTPQAGQVPPSGPRGRLGLDGQERRLRLGDPAATVSKSAAASWRETPLPAANRRSDASSRRHPGHGA